MTSPLQEIESALVLAKSDLQVAGGGSAYVEGAIDKALAHCKALREMEVDKLLRDKRFLESELERRGDESDLWKARMREILHNLDDAYNTIWALAA